MSVMHEMSIALNILEIVKEESIEQRVERVTEIRLAIGEISGVARQSLEFCFSIASKGTVADGAELVFENIPFRAECLACGSIFRVRDYKISCPDCGSKEIRTVSGTELFIRDIEVE
nr:hydrogenase maturation nickel metallochaperone HypA [Desulfobacterales bacterium]